MARRRLSLPLLALGSTLALAALPTPTAASGFQLVEQNASGLGTAFAGQAAVAHDASAVFFNPAALTGLKGWNLLVSVEPIGVSTTFANTNSSVPQLGPLMFPGPVGGDGGDAGKWIPVPNGYISGQVHDRVWVGVGVNAPFGLETNWASDWRGRFIGTRSMVRAINVNPTVAFKISDQLSIGGGANWQHFTAELGQNVAYGTLAYAGAAQAVAAYPAPVQQALLGGIIAQLGGPAGLATEGPVLISGDSNAWGWNVGGLVKLGEQAHVGVSYRSKVKHTIDGTATFTGAPTLLETGSTGPIGQQVNANFASGPVTTQIEVPDTLSIAASVKADKLELLADWTRTGWESIQSIDIVRTSGTALSSVPLHFANTWRAGVGACLDLDAKWTLRVGTAYDKSPVQDLYRTPRLPDADRYWAAAGLQWRVHDKVRLDAGYAHIFIKQAPSELVTTTSGSLVGDYTAAVNVLGVQVSAGF